MTLILIATLLAASVPQATSSEPRLPRVWPIRVLEADLATPIPGATVWAQVDLGPYGSLLELHHRSLGSAITDEDGIARIPLDGLSALHAAELGSLDLAAWIHKPGYRPGTHTEYLSRGERLPLPDEIGREGDADVALERGGSMVGRIVDRHQRPVAYATLCAGTWDEATDWWKDGSIGDDDSIASDASGRFVVGFGEREEVTLYGFHPGVGRGVWKLKASEVSQAERQVLSFEMEPPDDWIEVQVLQSDGVSPAQIHVECTPDSNRELPFTYDFMTSTDRAGKLRIPTWDGMAWFVEADQPISPQGDEFMQEYTVRVEAGSNEPIVLTRPNLRIRTQAPDGRPLKSVLVTLQRMVREGARWVPDPRALSSFRGMPRNREIRNGSDGAGNWFSSIHRGGRYVLRAESMGEARDWVAERTIDITDDDSQLEIELTLRPAPEGNDQVDVTFLDVDGSPIPKWHLSVAPLETGLPWFWSTERGLEFATCMGTIRYDPVWGVGSCQVTLRSTSPGFDLPLTESLVIAGPEPCKLVLKSPGRGGRLLIRGTQGTSYRGGFRTLLLSRSPIGRDEMTLTFVGHQDRGDSCGEISWALDGGNVTREASILLPAGTWSYRLLDDEEERASGQVTVNELGITEVEMTW